MMFCIYCGKGNPDDAVFCRSCGKQQPQSAERDATASDNALVATSSAALSSLPSASEPPSTATPTPMNMSATGSSGSSCPRCHQSDMSQSASSIVRGGISTTAYGGSSSGLGYIQGQGLVVTHGSHSGSAVNQTELSRRLTLPDPPKYSNPYLWMFALLFIPVCALFALGPVGVLLAALIWIGIGVGIYMWASNEAPKRKVAFDAAMSQYNTAKGKWEQLFYCHRDDIIYLPDGTYDHPNNMWSFLNSLQAEARSSSVPLPAVSSQKAAQVQPAASVQKPVKKHECVLNLQGHSGAVNSVTWSPDGKYIASGDSEGLMKVWEAPSSDQLFTFQHQSNLVHSIAWSPDSKYIALGGGDGTILVCETFSQKEVQSYKGHSGAVNSVVWSPDGKYIASGSSDKTIHVWEALTGRQVSIYKRHYWTVFSVAWSPDGKYIASGSNDAHVHIWEALAGKRVSIHKRHKSAVNSVVWSPDGKYIASGSSDKTIHVWEAFTGGIWHQEYRGHSGAVNSVAWSPDSKYIASAGGDNNALVWDTFAGKQVFKIELPSDGWVKFCSWSPDGKHLIYGTKTGIIQVWKLDL